MSANKDSASSGEQASSSGSLLSTDVKGLPCFNPRDDPTNLAERWKRWKRSFNLYLMAKGGTNDNQRVALLLHTGGAELQELYFTLIDEQEGKSFEACVRVLDEHFVPKANLPFERNQFRQMSQLNSEKVDQFVSRLRQKATTCEFANVAEAIRDQLIEKCFDPKLRRKFLERTNATLKDLQDIARAYEAVEQQMKAMGESVNALKHNTRSGGMNRGNTNQQRLKPNLSGGESRSPCYNCNRTGYFARDSSCPARGQNCNECGAKGHFSACCKAKEKRPTKGTKKDNVNRVSGKTVSPSEQNDYVFLVRNNYGSEGEVCLKVGGVRVEGVLIDCGASCNLIDYKKCSYLKENHVVCQSAQSEKKIFAYGQKEPMDVAGTFTTEIVCEASGETCVDVFTVIKGDGKRLLGKRIAEQLDVLRVGPEKEEEVYTVTEQENDVDIREKYPALFTGVGKLKGYKLKLHINEDVTPGLRDKVDEKLDELLDMEIIEEVPEATPTTWVSP